MISFASDNYAPVDFSVLKKIEEINNGHEPAYGNDRITEQAIQKFREVFRDPKLQVYFVFNGTGANTLGLFSILKPYESILTADTAHIHVDECGAPERISGVKIRTVPTADGKLSPDLIKAQLIRKNDEHYSQTKVVSITQSTEYGTLYKPGELKELCEFCHDNGLYVHMDGARISNAAVSLSMDFYEFTRSVGVDVLSFGGTKNGLMLGEAVLFLNPDLGKDFKFYRKQGMQLSSKMRYISAQFLAFFENDLWKKNAADANSMAKLFEQRLREFPQLKVLQKVESNGIFLKMPLTVTRKMQEKYHFYDWNEELEEVRLMCSFDTKQAEIELFIDDLENIFRKF